MTGQYGKEVQLRVAPVQVFALEVSLHRSLEDQCEELNIPVTGIVKEVKHFCFGQNHNRTHRQQRIHSVNNGYELLAALKKYDGGLYNRDNIFGLINPFKDRHPKSFLDPLEALALYRENPASINNLNWYLPGAFSFKHGDVIPVLGRFTNGKVKFAMVNVTHCHLWTFPYKQQQPI